MRLKKGDKVQIISGKDRGKNGKVLDVFPKINKIVVDGIALHRRHQRPKKQGQKGEIYSAPSPIDFSNALLFCDSCGKGVRAGVQVLENNKKIRVCKKCKNEI
ncbi:50S ribosomal protein L24 [Candidatus Giovannonibacteria bacterium]|nr:50S ribosomal protein L24 [Candidatus Giovannonibacteria bacterium]